VEWQDLMLTGESSPLLLMIALPLLVYYLWLCVTDPVHSGDLFVPTLADLERIPLPTWTSMLVFGTWVLFQALLYQFVPGVWMLGSPMPDGSRLRYRMNGVVALIIVMAVVWEYALSGEDMTWIYTELGSVLTTANLFAFGAALLLYLWTSRRSPAERSGSILQDYFIGVELNPRIGTFDLKFFFESRPGLIGWLLLNLLFFIERMGLNHANESPSDLFPIVLVVALQGLYVGDFFLNEEAILSTWDIKHEKLGWMLLWGCVVWVPFVFSLQAHYLLHNRSSLSVWAAAAIAALGLTGYVIFRGANSQKHRFREKPAEDIWGKPPEYIRTTQGSLLLTSGWWGLARHINYLGDLMMALAWCLPCGFGSPLPYFYFVYFLILLIHRERRDNAACRAKYGADWDAYCRKVPWRIVPYLY
jgi:protein-S-isoprenylcysteine O-methyltransferase Ste14